jgi:radical SAM protein with 4Fe4S-binding SPASM domain
VKEELSHEELTGVIDDIARFRPSVTLFGGEPLLYRGCPELIRHIKSKRLHCLMITNGSLAGKFARELVEAPLDELNVSLDGGRGLHDEIRGMPGLYDKITEALKGLARLKRELRSKKPLVNLQCTITKYNYTRLEELLDVAQEIGADSLTYHNLIFLEKGLVDRQKACDKTLGCSSADWEGFVFDPEIDPDTLWGKMERIKAAKRGFSVDFYPNFSKKALKEYYGDPSYMPSEYAPRCVSPWITAYVFPDGEVRPCLNFDLSFGNIKDEPFSRIWNGERALRYRKRLKDDRIFPVCVRCTELYRY